MQAQGSRLGAAGKIQPSNPSPDYVVMNGVDSMFAALREHWPEYLMEAAGLGMYMISACVVGVLLEYPGSPLYQAIRVPMARTILVGLARGLTVVGLVYSPWGKQSGAHFNPAITLTFCWLGKVAPWDACFYTVAQFLGGLAGILLTAALLGQWLADPAVNYAATVPGPAGQVIAFVGEFLISFGLMFVILIATNIRRIARFTGILAGALVAIYIVVERPYSGMSMNPARTLASAVPAMTWKGLWLYFSAPLLGMVLAGKVYLQLFGFVYCAKLHHDNDKRCIFHHRREKGRDANAPLLGPIRSRSYFYCTNVSKTAVPPAGQMDQIEKGR
jgi:aquaporin Z